MATHYIENEESGNHYYFEPNATADTQNSRLAQDRAYPTAVTSTVVPVATVGSSEYTSYPAGVAGVRLQAQQIRTDRNAYQEDDAHQWVQQQQHQSVAGFNKTVSQQQYQSPPSAAPQVRATVRTANTQEQHQVSSGQYHPQGQTRVPQSFGNYEQSNSPQSSQVISQYHYDARQQTTQPSTGSSYYQPSTSAQQIHYEQATRTDSPSRTRDPHGPAQQVLVRSVSSTSNHQNETTSNYQQPQNSPSQISPQSHQYQDQIQQYYSQLTPEQYQQLMRQQQLQRQQQEEQKRQQLAQQQYYLQQQTQQSPGAGQGRTNQDSHQYDEYQQRRVYQSSPNQEYQYRQGGQDHHEAYNRPVHIQGTVSPSSYQEPYRQQPLSQHSGQQNQVDTYYEQQQHITAQKSSPSSNYTQEHYRSTVNAAGAEPYQHTSQQQSAHQHIRTESERQHQDEQDYYAAQVIRQQQQQHQQQEKAHTVHTEAAQQHQEIQRVPQQQQHQEYQQIIQNDQPTKPVGIRGLMNKFTGPTTIQTYQPKSNISQTRHQSSSTYKTSSGPGQTTTTHTTNVYSMTYSSLPKSNEPPVNSAAYFDMLQQGYSHDTPSSTQQSAAPPHFQGPAPGFGALRDRFKTGSVTDSSNTTLEQRRVINSNVGNSSLSSLRDQFINRAQDGNQIQESSFSQRIQTVTRTIVGEEPTEKKETAPVSQPEDVQVQSLSLDDQAVSSEAAVADGNSLSGASSLDNEATLNTSAIEPATVSN